MGCEQTKVADAPTPSKTENSPIFTEDQINALRSTWPILSSELTKNGAKVFLLVFQVAPHLKKMFPFGHLSTNELLANETFLGHSRRFMQSVGGVIENLEDPDVRIQPILMSLGAKHALFKGFDMEYFAIFTASLNNVCEGVLGEEYSDAIRDAWQSVFIYIGDSLRRGYESGMNTKVDT